MVLKRIVRLDTGSIAAGSYADVRYAPEVSLKLKRIEVVEASGASLNNVMATLYIGDVPVLMPDASLAIFAAGYPSPITLDLSHPAGVFLTMRVTNNTSAAVRVYIHLVYEE